MTVGVTGLGTYLPESRLTAADIADRSDVPESVVVEKLGIESKHVCRGDGDHVTDMGVAAAQDALEESTVAAADLDMVLYHGSEYKDYVVWSAAAAIADRIGADDAFATESYTLCAGAPIALRQARAMLAAGEIESVLLVAASREEDLVDYSDPDSSFMFNFGSGASAVVLERDPVERMVATVNGSAARTDGRFAEDVILAGSGSRGDGSVETATRSLSVPTYERMKERLAEVTLSNFTEVADTALSRSGRSRSDIDLLAMTHVKRSFQETLLDVFDLAPDDAVYLSETGHIQSVDQPLATNLARERGLLEAGDTILWLAAGTGYTWAASVLTWTTD